MLNNIYYVNLLKSNNVIKIKDLYICNKDIVIVCNVKNFPYLNLNSDSVIISYNKTTCKT